MASRRNVVISASSEGALFFRRDLCVWCFWPEEIPGRRRHSNQNELFLLKKGNEKSKYFVTPHFCRLSGLETNGIEVTCANIELIPFRLARRPIGIPNVAPPHAGGTSAIGGD